MSMRAFSVAILASIALALGSLAACSDDDDGPPDATGGDNFVTGPSGEPTVAVPAPETPAAGGPSAGSASPPGAPAFSEPPSTTATANGQTVNAGIGTFCWTLLCVDK